MEPSVNKSSSRPSTTSVAPPSPLGGKPVKMTRIGAELEGVMEGVSVAEGAWLGNMEGALSIKRRSDPSN